MTTLRDLVVDTKRHLLGGDRPAMNKLTVALTATDTTISLKYDAGQVKAGTYLEVDLELLYVWSVNASAKTVEVERAQMGSVAAVHAVNAVVTLNPRFPDFTIARAINDDLLDLSAPSNGLFAVRVLELSGTSMSNGYDLAGASNLLDILAVSTSAPGSLRSWSPVTNFDLDHDAETDDFTSGYALRLHEGVHAGRQLRVLYKASFAPLANLTDDVELVSGLPASMHDIPPMGAAVRLVAPREIARNDTTSQGDSRRAQEVPPGAVASSMRTVAALRSQRIAAESGRLAQKYPERSFMPQSPSGWNGW